MEGLLKGRCRITEKRQDPTSWIGLRRTGEGTARNTVPANGEIDLSLVSLSLSLTPSVYGEMFINSFYCRVFLFVWTRPGKSHCAIIEKDKHHHLGTFSTLSRLPALSSKILVLFMV